MLNAPRPQLVDCASLESEEGPQVVTPATSPGRPVAAGGSGLTPAQWDRLRELATTLSPGQALWVSGYLAALGHAETEKPLTLVANEISATNASLPVRTLTILYGSETGNSSALAAALANQARALGLVPVVTDMADYKLRRIKDEQDLLIVVSTCGEGDPPQPAADFFEFVEGRKAPRLPDLRYAVLALGDSTYEYFCEAGKRLDRRLAELGATRLQPRVDCDIDFDEPAGAWTETVVKLLVPDDAQGTRKPTATVNAAAATALKAGATVTAFDRRNPYTATIIDNIVLTGRGSSKETRHIELSLAGSGLVFAPGDALGIAPRNDPALVAAMLTCLAVEAGAPLKLKDQRTTLGEALAQIFEITAASPRFLDHWATLSDAKELKRLSHADHAGERTAFLRDHHVIDVMRAFPVRALAPETLVAGLRPLQPRLYSIASSLAAMPDEVHLTVATVRYDLHGEARTGVASGHLADRGDPDTTLPVYVQANPHFRLPGDEVPILMIGAGTGIAPYRAFLQEREIRGATGRSWLFFGERNFCTDFLYQTEWQGHLRDGVLTRMDVAFSRDRAKKTYVQHRLQERAREVFEWLEEGAHVYVCGDAAHLAPDVQEALTTIVEQQGGLGREAADDYMRSLQRDHRYQRDVY